MQVGDLRVATVSFSVWNRPKFAGGANHIEISDFVFIVDVDVVNDTCLLLTRFGPRFVVGCHALGCRTSRLASV